MDNSNHDGFILKHFNRRFSRPLAHLLIKTRITPNQVTLFSFILALLSSGFFVFGSNIGGGILAQLSFIVDGVDGDLARAKGMVSKFGGFFDAVLDRYADAAIIVGMTIWCYRFGSYPLMWIVIVGLMSLVGALMISYSRARGEATAGLSFQGGIVAIASRDTRLFIVFVGSVLGQVYWTLLVLAILTNIVVAFRILYAHNWLSTQNPHQ